MPWESNIMSELIIYKQTFGAAPAGCYPYARKLDKHGYGVFRVCRKDWFAHRWVWQEFNMASLLPGSIIRHECDRPSCCNPDHLLLGSHSDNMKDKKNRQQGLKRDAMHHLVNTLHTDKLGPSFNGSPPPLGGISSPLSSRWRTGGGP